MRLSLLNLYLQDMEVISAEESLLRIDVTAIGTGNMTEEATETRISNWTELALHGQEQFKSTAPALPLAPGLIFENHSPDEVGRKLEQSGWKQVDARQPPNLSNPIS